MLFINDYLIIAFASITLLFAGIVWHMLFRKVSVVGFLFALLCLASLGTIFQRGVDHAVQVKIIAPAASSSAASESYGAEVKSATVLKFSLVGTASLLFASFLSSVSLVRNHRKNLGSIATLKEDRARFEILVNSFDSIIWEYDPASFQFKFVSKQAGRILGYAPDQWLADPGFRARILHPDDRESLGLCHSAIRQRKPFDLEYRVIAADGRVLWVRESGLVLKNAIGEPSLVRGTLQDITSIKEADLEMKRLNRSLFEASRKAGMAEVATSVLHNVGNVLNSISVSSSIASSRMKNSRAGNLRQTALLLQGHNGHLADFLTQDPKGRLIPQYLDKVTEQLTIEHSEICTELESLSQNIEHVKEIVAMQQGYASVSGVIEFFHPADLADEALRLNADKLKCCGVRVSSEFGIMPPQVKVDRHKVLQILVNLIQNAIQAMDVCKGNCKTLTIRVEPDSEQHFVTLSVRDTGIGITPENLTKIFRHGFTTREEGHGFGLHGAANFATELGGQLSVHSEGPGLGATFFLRLPTQ